MRPRRSTSVISAITRPAPEFASMPRWLRCQSEATPSSALYWHMGETTIRFASSRSASRIGENRALVMSHGDGWEGRQEAERQHREWSAAAASNPTGPPRRHPEPKPVRVMPPCAAPGLAARVRLSGWRVWLGPGSDHGPGLGGADGVAHAMEELLLRVIMLPAPAVVELDEMRAPALGEVAPFLRDLIERVRGLPFRHERPQRRQIRQAHGPVMFAITQSASDAAHRLCTDSTRKYPAICCFRRRPGTTRVAAGSFAVAPKTDPPGRGNPGGSQIGAGDRGGVSADRGC